VVPAVLAAAAGLSLAGTGAAQASTFTVTNCSNSSTTAGTLPDEAAAAMAGTSGPDTIAFDATCHLITLASTIDISKSVIITGPGAASMAVSGGKAVQVFDITAGTVAISGLTIEDGLSDPSGGGIENAGVLTLTGTAVTGNATVGAAPNLGGGIFNTGTLTIANSAITDNNVNTSDDGGLTEGGGISSTGTLSITGSTIAGNNAGGGQSVGGGIYSSGTLRLTDSTIADNTADVDGDGDGGGIDNNGTLTVADSTITGDTAADLGGGIANTSTGGTLNIIASTVADNSAPSVGLGGGIFNEGTVNLAGSIVAGNTGSNGPNCYNATAWTSLGYNLTDDSTGAACGFSQASDVADSDPLLGKLAANGGPTQTMLPGPDSPAVGVIPPGTTVTIGSTTVSLCAHTDQRGVTSSSWAFCTIGAVEVADNPVLKATLASKYPETRYGWYRAPVTVSFTCAAAGSPLNGPCPAPVTVARSGSRQVVTESIYSRAGGAASVKVLVSLDSAAPKVTVTGVRNGATYATPGPAEIRCTATALSGLAGACKLTIKRTGTAITWTATATSKAGLTTTIKGRARLRRRSAA
jgi:hypothetical protein